MTCQGRIELLVFAFDVQSGAFEGRLGGALQRAESGGAIRVLEALFAGRDAATGTVVALRVHGGAGDLVTALADFRLDPERRRLATTVAQGEAGDDNALHNLVALLAPGSAVVAVRIIHVWRAALADAVSRIGGETVADDLDDDGPEAEDLVRRALSALRRAAAATDCSPAVIRP